MAISTTQSRTQYQGNGATTIFSFPYLFFQNTDIFVTLFDTSTNIGTILAYGTGYTVTGAGNAGGGSVTLATAPTNTQFVTIQRIVTLTQPDVYNPNDALNSATLMGDLDKRAMAEQQISDTVGRSISYPPTDALTLSSVLPPATVRAGKQMVFDANGVPTVTNSAVIGMYRGQYAAGVVYNYGDTIFDDSEGDLYIAIKQYTSISIVTDLSAGDIVLLFDASEATEEAEAAAAAAAASATTAGTAQTAAAASATAAATSAASAAALLTSLPIAGRLTFVSSTSISLGRYNGLNVPINGSLQTIPSGGVSLANTSLVAATFYYVYVFMSGTTMTLEASTTVPVISTTTGLPIKTGDATRLLVGAVYMGAGSPGTFVDSATQGTVASYFNRIPKSLVGATSTGSTSTASAVVEIASSGRVGFISFGDFAADFSANGYGSNSTSTSTAWHVSIGLDGTTPVTADISINQTTGSFGTGYSVRACIIPAAGYHFVTLLGGPAGNGGTANYTNAVMLGIVWK